MKRKLVHMIVLAGVTAASSMTLADSSGFRIVVPMPAPTSRPSDADLSAVTDAQQALASAQKTAQAAHAELVSAHGKLGSVTRDLQSQLENGSTVADAAQAMTDAKAAYDQLAQPLLDSLQQRADYRNARAAVARAQQTSAEFTARADAGTDERVAAALQVLAAKKTVTNLENAALDSNPDVVTARKNYLEAAHRLRELRSRLWDAIRQDPTYVAASQALDSARQNAMNADQQLASVEQDLAVAQHRLADKQQGYQQIQDWSYRHGLPDPP